MTGAELANMDMVDIPGFELTAEDYARKQKALVRKIDFRLMPCLLGMIVLKYVFNLTPIRPQYLRYCPAISTAMLCPMQEFKALRKI